MNLKSTLYEILYLKLCREYAQHIVGDKPADAILRFLCSIQFWRVHRFWPNFVNPRLFSEKVVSRMLHNRSPQLTLLNDKLRVRTFVEAKVGADYLVPLLWSGDDPDKIPFDQLPSNFVIKATHGGDYNILVKDKASIDKNEIRLKLSKWLKENYCDDFRLGIEWGYKHINPSIIIEKYLETDGHPPIDYKFYCFSGRVEVLTMHFDRFIEHKTKAFDRNFEPHEFRYHFPHWTGECQRPQNFEEMIRLAETLSEEFDFMRIDLYNIKGSIYFSEFTPYTGGVSTKFLPREQDILLGEKWKWK